MNTTTTIIKSLFLSFAVSVACLLQPASVAKAASRPNLLFIIASRRN